MRVLVIEDDKIIGDGLLTALKLEGYAVDWVEDKESATLAFETHEYEMLLMDIGFAGFYLVYAFAFNWAYDVIYPVPGQPRAAR